MNDFVIVSIFLVQLPHEEAKMKVACQSMLALYPNQSYPLEVLCCHYLKTGKALLSCSQLFRGFFRNVKDQHPSSFRNCDFFSHGLFIIFFWSEKWGYLASDQGRNGCCCQLYLRNKTVFLLKCKKWVDGVNICLILWKCPLSWPVRAIFVAQNARWELIHLIFLNLIF